MQDISITMSKKDMKQLFKHLYCGNWVLTATKEKPLKEYEEFKQRFFAIMKNYILIDQIEYNTELGMYFISYELDEQLHKLIDEYDDDIFWEELIDRLAHRDIETEYSKEEIENMEQKKYFEMLSKKERHTVTNSKRMD